MGSSHLQAKACAVGAYDAALTALRLHGAARQRVAYDAAVAGAGRAQALSRVPAQCASALRAAQSGDGGDTE